MHRDLPGEVYKPPAHLPRLEDRMPRTPRPRGLTYTTSTPLPFCTAFWRWKVFVPSYWIEDDSTPC